MTTGTKRQVFHGTANKTPGGVTAAGLKKTPSGRIVSAAKSEAAKSSPALAAWREAVKKAKIDLNIPIEGPGSWVPPAKGTALYSLTKKIYARNYNNLSSYPL